MGGQKGKNSDMKTLDMQGKPCPIPVIEAKKVLASPGEDGVVLLVDNIVAVQNLEKMAKGMGYAFAHTQRNEALFAAEIRRGDAPPAPQEAKPEAAMTAAKSGGETVALLTGDQMGRGSEELGKILMKGFVFSLSELPEPPGALLLLNGGVRLTVEGSNVLDDLRRLEEKGTKIRVCGTCLNYYGLTEQLAVGEITDMFGITAALHGAGRVITL